jgi:hypothetical protein
MAISKKSTSRASKRISKISKKSSAKKPRVSKVSKKSATKKSRVSKKSATKKSRVSKKSATKKSRVSRKSNSQNNEFSNIMKKYKSTSMSTLSEDGYAMFNNAIKDADKNVVKDEATKLINEFINRKVNSRFMEGNGEKIAIVLALIGYAREKYNPIKGLHKIGVSIVDKPSLDDEEEEESLLEKGSTDRTINEEILSRTINRYRVKGKNDKYSVTRNLAYYSDLDNMTDEEQQKFMEERRKFILDITRKTMKE